MTGAVCRDVEASPCVMASWRHGHGPIGSMVNLLGGHIKIGINHVILFFLSFFFVIFFSEYVCTYGIEYIFFPWILERWGFYEHGSWMADFVFRIR